MLIKVVWCFEFWGFEKTQKNGRNMLPALPAFRLCEDGYSCWLHGLLAWEGLSWVFTIQCFIWIYIKGGGVVYRALYRMQSCNQVGDIAQPRLQRF